MRFSKFVYRFLAVPFLFVAMLGSYCLTQPLPWSVLVASGANFLENKVVHTLRYAIDRSQVPPLYYNDITLMIDVGQAESVEVLAGGNVVPHEYASASGILRFTTSADSVDVLLTNVVNSPSLGTFTKAELKDDKDFAWSLGMDDNSGLHATVSVMERFGWNGTFFMIGQHVEDLRDEDWIADVPYLHRKIDVGWSVGNHTWSHSCNPIIDEQGIINGYNRMREVVDSSSRPSYEIISFAAPCFVSEYHPIILAHRNDQRWPVQFNESGNQTPMIVDPDATEDILLEGEFNPAAYAFDYDQPIGRDAYLEIGQSQTLIDKLDWMASRHAEHGEHMWQNTLVHAGKEALVESVATHLHNTYGPNGTDQIWVAPSDQIYSYLLVRDRSIVTLVDGGPDLPTATPAPTNTPTRTNTPTSTNTLTPTNTPTLTNAPVNDGATPSSTPDGVTPGSSATDVPTAVNSATPVGNSTEVPVDTQTPIPTNIPTPLPRLHLPVILGS